MYGDAAGRLAVVIAKAVYGGGKGVFFLLYFLITHSHVPFLVRGFYFFSNPFAICTSYFFFDLVANWGLKTSTRSLPAAPRPQFPR